MLPGLSRGMRGQNMKILTRQEWIDSLAVRSHQCLKCGRWGLDGDPLDLCPWCKVAAKIDADEKKLVNWRRMLGFCLFRIPHHF